jgi:uncharacterized protein YdbL (DUF1318 family)
MKGRFLAALLLCCCFAGCPKVRPATVARKTQLENQILGTFDRLEDEVILASSVRGEQAGTAAKLSPLQREALEAMLDREFNRDDIDALKAQQVLGEGNDGMLVLLTPPADPKEAQRAKALVERDNRDRQLIIQRVVQINRELSDKDLPLVRRLFYRLNVQAARPGDRVQQPDGQWTTVRQPAAGADAPQQPKK